jgi:DNA-binding NarL/FixJ family response regulator
VRVSGRRQATRLIISRWQQVRVIAVTSFLEEEKVRAALDAGASGYLLKDAVADAVRVVAAYKSRCSRPSPGR